MIAFLLAGCTRGDLDVVDDAPLFEWDRIGIDYNQSFSGIDFCDADKGNVVDHLNCSIFRSLDGGLSWSQTKVATMEDLPVIHCSLEGSYLFARPRPLHKYWTPIPMRVGMNRQRINIEKLILAKVSQVHLEQHTVWQKTDYMFTVFSLRSSVVRVN